MPKKEETVKLKEFSEASKDIVPDKELEPEKPKTTLSFKPSEEPLVLVMDGETVEDWLVNGHIRKRGIFDRVEVTGENLENKHGRTGIPGLVFSMAYGALKPGGELVIPDSLGGFAEGRSLEKAKGRKKAGFLSFVK